MFAGAEDRCVACTKGAKCPTIFAKLEDARHGPPAGAMLGSAAALSALPSHAQSRRDQVRREAQSSRVAVAD